MKRNNVFRLVLAVLLLAVSTASVVVLAIDSIALVISYCK